MSWVHNIYRSVVGSIMFAMICTRWDITYVVRVIGWFMTNPDGEHWDGIKRIIKCIDGTSCGELCFGGSIMIYCQIYVDSIFLGNLDPRKTTS